MPPNRDRGRPRDLSPPTPPYIRITNTAVRPLQHACACPGVDEVAPHGSLTPGRATWPCERPVTGLYDRSGLPCVAAGTMPSADSSHGIRENYSSLSQFPWHATFRGAWEASRGKLSYRPCIDAGFIKHSPLWMEDFTVACPLVPAVPHLVSGSCPSPRTFVPRFLQMPPREDTLALPLSFGSTHTWTGDFHSRA
jgi:hypothetical protein